MEEKDLGRASLLIAAMLRSVYIYYTKTLLIEEGYANCSVAYQ